MKKRICTLLSMVIIGFCVVGLYADDKEVQREMITEIAQSDDPAVIAINEQVLTFLSTGKRPRVSRAAVREKKYALEVLPSAEPSKRVFNLHSYYLRVHESSQLLLQLQFNEETKEVLVKHEEKWLTVEKHPFTRFIAQRKE